LTRPIHLAAARGWGLVEWVRPIIDVVFDGVADTVEYQLTQILGPEAYDRFQIDLHDASDALDDASAMNLEALEREATKLIAARSDDLDRVCAALVAPGEAV
ncbi:MAG: hypothetical protein QOG11_1401, partial [Solirubrobacteraceae bacterium]|nr:hypothetical protein [Solirubrobacteraceae bacterium]